MSIMLDDYIHFVPIEKGGQGVTYEAVHRYTKRKVCIKKIKKPALEELRGIRYKKRLNHPQIVETIDVLEDEDYIYHVMALIKGKSLKHYYHSLSNRECISIACQLIEILDDFCQHQLVYNDLKPDNVILNDKGRIALIDVGAILEVGDLTSKRYGAKLFVAPEYMKGKVVDWKSDLYSLSKVLYYICHRPSPFLKHWIKKASQQRFSSLYDAYQALCQSKRNMTCFLVCLCCVFSLGFISKTIFQSQSFDFSLPQNRGLFHSLMIYEYLDGSRKMQLSNELLNYEDELMWEMQYALLKESSDPLLHQRFQFMNSYDLKELDLSSNQLDFYMHYLCHLNHEAIYKKVYSDLFNQSSTTHQKQWLIEIAYRLHDKKALEACFEKCSGEKKLQALCLYRLFQQGYYQQSYLHQAIELLEGYEHTSLYQRINEAIDQWGDLA